MLSTKIGIIRSIFPLRSIMTTGVIARGPVWESIEKKLITAFSPSHLEVRNESHMHNV
jgi:stress-induced morphogen